MDCAEDHTGAAGSNATAAMVSALPRKHRESVLTIWFIVSSAAPLAGQARHRGNYSRFIDAVGVRDRANRRRPFAMGSMLEYDLVVIGSGPGGQKAAIAAAKLGKTVAVVERGRMLGGVCVNTGTIPSKTLREAVVYLTGMSQREMYGASYRVKEKITPGDLLARTTHVITKEQDVVRNQLMRNRVDLHTGHARFLDEHTVCVDDQTRGERTTVRGEYIVIATGTKPARPTGVEFDEDRVLDSDGILDLKSLPTTMVVVGAGVIGIEYASMFAALGTKVTVVEKRDSMLEFCDPEIIEALKFHLRDLAVTFRFGEEVTAVDVGAAGTVTTLASGKQIPAETVMYSAGRQGQTEHLDLPNAGLETDNRGRIVVDSQFQTKVDHIYAVGDVIGFPALAATSMDQGRLAAYHAFGEPAKGMTDLQPIGIYSIPEVSYVGATEVDLTKNAIPYEVGVSRYRELARGQIAGDSYGMLKLLVHTESLKLLGVHIFGTSATEMVHIGQAVMGCGGTVEYLVDAVFNYPTFSEAYKVAALDVMNKLRALNQFRT
jgi:NAD(P) transhydrogenase